MYDVFAVFFACAVLATHAKHKWAPSVLIGVFYAYSMIRTPFIVSSPWVGPFDLSHAHTNGVISDKDYIALCLFWICALAGCFSIISALFAGFASLFIPVRDDATAAVTKED
jgi:hypothetical protein